MISDTEYIILGSTPLDDIDEALSLSLESEDYDSIAGHIINLLQHFPEINETAEDEYAIYTVLEVDGNRIDKLRMILKPHPEDEEEDSEE